MHGDDKGPIPEGAAARRLARGARDTLLREEPLVLEIDGERVTTMRTPGADEDLATGFLLSEGIVTGVGEIASIRAQKGIPLDMPGAGDGGEAAVADVVCVTLAAGATRARADALRRRQEIRPSCGLCGIEDLRELVPEGRELSPGRPGFELARLPALLGAFTERQELFRATGGAHAAALSTTQGEILAFGEDIGRHNAVDKAIGEAARASRDLGSSLALLSGRAGYELVAKCLRVGVPIVVAVGAASALALDLAREAGASLIGFARGERARVYWDEERLG